MTEFVNDLFTGSNGTRLELHTPDLGGIWDQVFVQPNGTSSSFSDAIITSNYLEGAIGGRGPVGESSLYRNAADPATNEYDVRATITLGVANNDAFFAMVGRMSAAGTNNAVDRYVGFYRYAVTATKQFSLRKVVSSVETILDFFDEDIGLGSFALKLEIRDAAKKVFLGAVEKCTSADDAITQDGRAGLSAPESEFLFQTNNVDSYVAETAAPGVAVITGVAQLAGSGAIAPVAEVAIIGVVALVGAGVLAGTGLAILAGSVALSGQGVMAESGLNLILGDVDLAGAGVLQGSGLNIMLGAAQLAGAGNLAGVGHAIVLGSVALSGVGVLLADGTVITLGVTEGIVNFVGAGTLAGAELLIIHAIAQLAGAGVVAPVGDVLIIGAAQLAGAGAIAGVGELILVGSVALSGAGALAATGNAIVLGVLPLAGAGALAAAGEVVGDFIDFGEIKRLIVASASDVYKLQAVATSIDGVTATEVRMFNITDGEIVPDSTVTTTSPTPVVLTSVPLALTGSKEYKMQMKGV